MTWCHRPTGEILRTFRFKRNRDWQGTPGVRSGSAGTGSHRLHGIGMEEQGTLFAASSLSAPSSLGPGGQGVPRPSGAARAPCPVSPPREGPRTNPPQRRNRLTQPISRVPEVEESTPMPTTTQEQQSRLQSPAEVSEEGMARRLFSPGLETLEEIIDRCMERFSQEAIQPFLQGGGGLSQPADPQHQGYGRRWTGTAHLDQEDQRPWAIRTPGPRSRHPTCWRPWICRRCQTANGGGFYTCSCCDSQAAEEQMEFNPSGYDRVQYCY